MKPLAFIDEADVYCRLSYGLRGAARLELPWTAIVVLACCSLAANLAKLQVCRLVAALQAALLAGHFGSCVVAVRMQYAAICLADEGQMEMHMDGRDLVVQLVKEGQIPYDVVCNQDFEMRQNFARSMIFYK